jgi:membrane protease YdiL (CAAX protease family)
MGSSGLSNRGHPTPAETESARDRSDPTAAGLRGFGPLGILAIVAILAANFVVTLLSAVLVLVWAHWSRTPWCEIGYARPVRWARSLSIGIPFGIAFKLLMKAIVMPLLGAPPVNRAYHYLVGNSAALPATLFTMIVIAGIGEETVYRGYMFERLGKLLGSAKWARASIVLITAGLFAAAHYPDQGLAGAEQALITGLLFGTIFSVTRRIWMLMVAHAAFDLASVAIIYWDLETRVAHFVFK